jgi:alpha-galactosidase
MRTFAPLLAIPGALAIDNGLGRTPPMGWRSWNLYGGDVNQQLLQGIMDGMVSKKRMVDGQPTSLCDLGYCDVGLDDNWQVCSDNKKYHYHDDAGIPVINRDRFPDMIVMTDYAHKRGLTAGWYMNNCICAEKADATDAMYQSDVAALTEFGFDAVKLDGCGTQRDLDKWSQLLNATGRPVMIENCHWGGTVPTANWCPWNFFRSSGDIQATYGSVVGNLQTTIQWAEQGLSKPGCWAYPDMLEVGCAHDAGGLNKVEAQTHFSAWAIVSSPLTLSHDVNNDTIMDAIWPVISNKEVIAVNQEWAGHSGSPFKKADTNVTLDNYYYRLDGMLKPHIHEVPSWQFFYKPLKNNRFAVLLINHDSNAQDLTLTFTDIPGNTCTKCQVRCLIGHKDLGSFDATIVAKAVESHGSRFFVVSPAAEESVVV